MADSTLSALTKRHWSRSLAPSTHSSQSMTHPLLRNASAYRNDPSHRPYPHPNMVDLSFRLSSATLLHDQVPGYGEF